MGSFKAQIGAVISKTAPNVVELAVIPQETYRSAGSAASRLLVMGD